jgi:hypothetical protein
MSNALNSNMHFVFHGGYMVNGKLVIWCTWSPGNPLYELPEL